jgi:ubiquinone/menaquinone biosynthesis C-methylase UbiE/uncharacterized protein YbaR (Trm112 family)
VPEIYLKLQKTFQLLALTKISYWTGEPRNHRRVRESMSTDDLIENLICPDCRAKIVSADDARLVCTQCKRSFEFKNGVIQMLPLRMHRNYEDDAWKTLPYEGRDKPAWMALLHKRDRIIDFYERTLPNFGFPKNVLEVGAGTSWASALIKKKSPQTLVVTTDISPFALEKGAAVARLLDSSVDYRVACDAECLPFADKYFDVVLSNATIHHFQDPLQGISEFFRVLRSGGRSCALGEVAAGALFKKILTSRVGPAGKRARSLEVEENVYSLKTWKEFFRTCGFTDITVDFDKTWEHKLYDWFTALYYRIVSTFPDVLLGDFLPCNVDIHALKPTARMAED